MSRRVLLFGVALAAIALLAILAIGAMSGGRPSESTSGSPVAPTIVASASSASPTGIGSDPSPSAVPPSSGPNAPATASPAAEPVVLVGAGDIADCRSEGDEATAMLLDGIAGTVFTLGDNAYENGTFQEFERCYDPSWGRHRDRTRPVPGNHEYNTPRAAGYFRYFGAAAGDPAAGYYAYDLGAWRIYALNSNCSDVACGPRSRQVDWLRADLAANPRTCVAAYWHHPRFSSGDHGNNPSTEALWQALSDAGADLVLAGHDHQYERFGPQTPEGAADPERGIVSFVVGTGGRSFYEFEDVKPNSLVRETGTAGVLKLTLAPTSYEFEFVPVAGKTFTDTGTVACH